MKNTKHFILYLLTVVTFCLTYSSCTKDLPDEPCVLKTEKTDIPATERSAFIYKGGEKLTFRRYPQMDTLVMLGGNLTSGYPVVYETQDVECPTTYYGQMESVIFNGSVNNQQYQIHASILVDDPRYKKADLRFIFYANGAERAVYLRAARDYSRSIFYETDTFNGVVYSNVVKDPMYDPSSNNFHNYYNKDFGLLKIEHQDGQFLELIKKE